MNDLQKSLLKLALSVAGEEQSIANSLMTEAEAVKKFFFFFFNEKFF
jgi:hypothetical protein